MKIILEGNECTGKDTLAIELGKRLNMDIVRGSSFEIAKKSNEEMFMYLVNLTNLQNVIVNRYAYSNLVYATLYPNNTILTGEQVGFLETMLQMQDSLVIYLYSDVDTLTERMKDRGDDYVSIDRLESINYQYESMWMGCKIKPIRFNTGKLSTEEVADQIVGLIK